MDWSLTEGAHIWIKANFSPGKTILELGSGEGSARLAAAGFHMVCVEHDKTWVKRYSSLEYYHAPLRRHKPVAGFQSNQWYDKDIMASTKTVDYSLIIVDGPPGDVGRSGFLKYFDLFKPGVPILFDDLHRSAENLLARKVSARLKSPLVSFNHEGKSWGYIWPGRVL
jgi:hypothetical protein